MDQRSKFYITFAAASALVTFARGLALLALGIIFLTTMAFTAPLFVIVLMDVIVGPAVFEFILAAYRTMVYLRRATFEAESAASSIPLSKSH